MVQFLLYLVLMLQSLAPQLAPAPVLEPYGGCKEAYAYPDSAGYADCVELGLVPSLVP